MGQRRRNRDVDSALGVAQLIGLLALAAMFLAPVRQMLLSLGVFVIGVVVLAGVIAFGVFLIRCTERTSPFDSTHLTAVAATPESPTARQKNEPQTTADLIEQVRSIDWFQFEKLVALVYRKLGYNVTRRGGANPDGGIDIVVEKVGSGRLCSASSGRRGTSA
jgi:hypothetical protein